MNTYIKTLKIENEKRGILIYSLIRTFKGIEWTKYPHIPCKNEFQFDVIRLFEGLYDDDLIGYYNAALDESWSFQD